MNKELKQQETYESPSLRVFCVKPMQCIALSTTNTPGAMGYGFDEELG